MKHQDLVLQLMRNCSLYFIHPKKRPPVGENSPSSVAFRGAKIKATTGHWPGSDYSPLVTESSLEYHIKCGIYGYTHGVFNLEITLQSGGKSG